VIFEGETQVLEITVDGVPAAVRTDRGVSVHRGESVSIGFNASDILLFDAETGARLPRDGAHAE
jgi:ABC-type sugar transport system ATPase subunit